LFSEKNVLVTFGNSANSLLASNDMDAMRNLAQGEQCSVDGTASGANAMSRFVDQAMGLSGGKGMVSGPGGMVSSGSMAHPRQQNAMELGFAQGMGLRGANVARGADFAREFSASSRLNGPPHTIMSGESMMRG